MKTVQQVAAHRPSRLLRGATAALNRQRDAPSRRQVDDHAITVYQKSVGQDLHRSPRLQRRATQECKNAAGPDRWGNAVRRPGPRRKSDRMFLRMLRFLTAGESHGKALVAILEGVPSGLLIDFDAITFELRRRQGGYGRGRRMAIESDRAEALSGIRHGLTTGAPIALQIPNKDWENWQKTMYS